MSLDNFPGVGKNPGGRYSVLGDSRFPDGH